MTFHEQHSIGYGFPSLLLVTRASADVSELVFKHEWRSKILKFLFDDKILLILYPCVRNSITHLTLILSASRASVGFKTSTPHRPSASDTSTPNFFSNYDPTQYVETHFEKKSCPLAKHQREIKYHLIFPIIIVLCANLVKKQQH